MDLDKLVSITKLLRRDVLISTTTAGSGHPSSSLSPVELLTMLFFSGIYKTEDHFVLSKGHAAPLLYSIFHAAEIISEEELLTLRKFGSKLEGHPTPRFPYVEAATGSLGQGLSMGLGIALGLKKQNKDNKAYVLLGDSEFAEGQNYEALQLASYYKCNNLIGILDVNRLGQRGETMVGWDLQKYKNRIESFGWNTYLIENGNDLKEVQEVFTQVSNDNNKTPVMIIAKTKKGKGVSILEDKNGWHGKPLDEKELQEALKEIGEVDLNLKVKVPFTKPQENKTLEIADFQTPNYDSNTTVSTREAYGDAITALADNKEIVVLDAEVSNSTYANKFSEKYPDRFFEMFVAEQNMISVGLGISKTGFIPFISSFSAFLTRGFDQIRMSQYSNPNIKLIGSHAGVHIGPDGPSQMGLEDISMMRSILESVVFYPSDAISTAKLTNLMAENEGLFYLRTTRDKTPVIYKQDEEFVIGGSKILKQSDNDKAVIFTAGITLHEALNVYDQLKKEGINIAVVDLYCVKPLDEKTVRKFSKEIKNVVVVEDHYPAGGIGEAVKSTLIGMNVNLKHLAVYKLPMSGKPEELLAYEEIDSNSIVKTIRDLLK